jgi:NADH dehydrogenase [ubiquinone] 1 alpha subcomplex assembly factor 7
MRCASPSGSSPPDLGRLILADNLAERLANRIAGAGPITVADYMTSALTDPDYGYYTRARPDGGEPLGAAGDFTTAPEISQLFGELIGAWLIDCWRQAGSPDPVNLVELGPGRGTLMADIMRVARPVPEWRSAIRLHLVEVNPSLRRRQGETLAGFAPHWHDALADVPDGPVMLVANEFLDALPIRQLVFWDGVWRERLVGWSQDAGFHFTLSPGPSALSLLVPPGLNAALGTVFELSPAAIAVTTEICRRIAAQGGAALVIDYGRATSGPGESLQAVRDHRMVPALQTPGEADLSAHVDFGAVARIGRETGVAVAGPETQGAFLSALGIALRAARVKERLTEARALDVDQAVSRLTHSDAMGDLFKVVAITAPGMVPAGFGLEP